MGAFNFKKMKNLLERLKKSNINIGNSNQVREFLIGKTIEIIGYEGVNNQVNGNPHGIPLKKELHLHQHFNMLQM